MRLPVKNTGKGGGPGANKIVE